MVKKKRDSLISNYLYNTIFSIATLVLPFLTTPYVSRVLGADGVGEYSYELSIVTYFTIVCIFGSAAYGKRQVAFTRDNKEDLSATFWNVFAFRCITTLLATTVFVLFSVLIGKLTVLRLVVALNIVFVATDISWFFQGLEKFRLLAIRNLIVKLIGCAAIFIFVKQPSDVWVYALILSAANIIGSIALFGSLAKLVLPPKKVTPFNEIIEMLQLFVPTIASQVYLVLDKSMIGWITKSEYANGCYEQAEKIVRICLTVVSSISVVVLPRVANLNGKGENERAKKYIYTAYSVTWLLAIPITFGLILIAPTFVPIFLGNGFEQSTLLLQIFAPLVVIIGCAYVTGVGYLVPTKQQNIYSVSVIASAVVNLIMNIVLIPQIGAIGAAIASVTAEGTGAILQFAYCFKKKQLFAKVVFKSSLKYLLSGIVMAAALVPLQLLVNNSIFKLLVMVIGGCVLYFGVLLILKDEILLMCLGKIKNLFVKQK